MKILQNEGKFEVIYPDFLKQLNTIEIAGRVCWKSDFVPEKRDDFIRMLIKKGHHSVLEHSSMTVRFWDVSRGFTHELVRHRLAAFSQRSTRFVNPVKKECSETIAPPSWERPFLGKDDSNRKANEIFDHAMKNTLKHYKELIDAGWPPQDARQILPIGIETEIVVTANFREWRHIFEVRCQEVAHWEIRTVMCALLAWCQENIPVIFEDFTLHGSNGCPNHPEEMYAIKE